MAHISDILKIEKERADPSSWNIIHLFKEGGFYRAFEWSAWLISVITYNDEVRKATTDRRPLTATHKRIGDSEDTYIFVGFPLNSTDKFIPQRTAFTPVSDTQIDIAITLPQPADGTEVTHERLLEAFAKWKQSVKIKEPKPNTKERAAVPAGSRARLTAIMADILAYPLEQHTLIENTQYLSDIKQQLASLI